MRAEVKHGALDVYGGENCNKEEEQKLPWTDHTIFCLENMRICFKMEMFKMLMARQPQNPSDIRPSILSPSYPGLI